MTSAGADSEQVKVSGHAVFGADDGVGCGAENESFKSLNDSLKRICK